MDNIPKMLSKPDNSSNGAILDALRRAGDILKTSQKSDYWDSEAGQTELLRMIDDRNQRPPPSGLNVMDYTEQSKAMLSSTGVHNAEEEEWIEVELCAHTGACDTVMPKSMCPRIPIRPSLQSLSMMEYEVADGRAIPNLGERRCMMWTEGAGEARQINLQVADVHKALLSLSRCADMGFESRFGRLAGALIDEETEEVIPLQRKGNPYVLKCWLKAAPFGGPEKR